MKTFPKGNVGNQKYTAAIIPKVIHYKIIIIDKIKEMIVTDFLSSLDYLFYKH